MGSVIIDIFMLVAKRFLIAGRVQGVGFRFFVEHRAAVEGVHGWVRNLPDGRVEARTVLTATISADHRAVDGRRAAQCLAAIDRHLQAPEQL